MNTTTGISTSIMTTIRVGNGETDTITAPTVTVMSALRVGVVKERQVGVTAACLRDKPRNTAVGRTCIRVVLTTTIRTRLAGLSSVYRRLRGHPQLSSRELYAS